MKYFKNYVFLILLINLSSIITAQENNLILPPDHIKSIVLSPNKENAFAPIIKLGQSFTLSFDDLEADEKIYYFKIEHCDYDWQKSNLVSTEYLSGFSKDRIRNYENSFNTLLFYTHYKIQIPNKDIRIKISGNYLISILDDDENIVFTRKFIVYQPKVDVGVTVHRSREINYINEKQDVEFVINHPNLLLRDPNNDIKVAVYQNNDWNSVIKNIKPKYTRNGQLLYNYVSDISFWAANEYLYFDTKEIRNATNNIAKTRLFDIFNTYLYIVEERYNRAYSFNPDVNGNFVLRTIDSDDTDLEGDYSKVHFSLESFKDIGDNDIYIYGAFNNWQITDENKMTYNNQTKLYEATLLFKQGFYNYTHVIADNNKNIDQTAIDGSYYQTENEYTVIVYFKQFGDRYTQVIGMGSANSKILEN